MIIDGKRSDAYFNIIMKNIDVETEFEKTKKIYEQFNERKNKMEVEVKHGRGRPRKVTQVAVKEKTSFFGKIKESLKSLFLRESSTVIADNIIKVAKQNDIAYKAVINIESVIKDSCKYLVKHEKGATCKDICDTYNHSHWNVYKSLNYLVNCGYCSIEKMKCVKRGKRCYRYVLDRNCNFNSKVKYSKPTFRVSFFIKVVANEILLYINKNSSKYKINFCKVADNFEGKYSYASVQRALVYLTDKKCIKYTVENKNKYIEPVSIKGGK